MYDFEIFRKEVGTAHTDEFLITIQRRGTISLNMAAYRALRAPDAVELLFDPGRRVVGFRAADVRARDAHVLRPTMRRPVRGPFLISASGFTNYYGIDTTVGLRWVGYLDDEDVLCIDLSTDGSTVRSNRAQRHTGPSTTARTTT